MSSVSDWPMHACVVQEFRWLPPSSFWLQYYQAVVSILDEFFKSVLQTVRYISDKDWVDTITEERYGTGGGGGGGGGGWL